MTEIEECDFKSEDWSKRPIYKEQQVQWPYVKTIDRITGWFAIYTLEFATWNLS